MIDRPADPSALTPAYRWIVPSRPPLDADLAAAAARHGISARTARILAARGHRTLHDLDAFFGEPDAGLHDAALLPDGERAARRLHEAGMRHERVMVFGDFDADGLTGLAILVKVLRQLGADAAPYVPSRLDEGHGLSAAAVAAARDAGRTLIVTVDCGTASAPEITLAASAGIDVIVTDHHHVGPELPPAIAVVNPRRRDSRYPDGRLAGSGVAFKLACLLLRDVPDGPALAMDLVDLATIGTVADMAPLAGENRCIARLGLARMAHALRPGLAALLVASGSRADLPVDLDTIGYVLAPRLNAAGRMGDATTAAELLLSDDPAEIERLAGILETSNVERRDVTAAALAEARVAAAATADDAVIVVAGDWPVGVIGLVAGRLAEERGRAAVVLSRTTTPWRGSARSAGGLDLAVAFERGAHLFERYGGHAGAAGCTLEGGRLEAFRAHMLAVAAELPPPDPLPPLPLDLVLRAPDLSYQVHRELLRLQPCGVGNPRPVVAVSGLVVARVRPASGGHTQLTLRKGAEVLDAIAFGRSDLAERVREGDHVDVCAHLASRTFGGYESLQLEVRDVAPAGTLDRLIETALAATTATSTTVALPTTPPVPVLTGAA